MRALVHRIGAAAAAVLVASSVTSPAWGQDSPRLVEEVVAHVNADIITRSQYFEAVADAERDFKENFKEPEASQKFLEFRPKILDMMIDNLLLVQKGQDLQIDVEAQINLQIKRQADEQRKSITEFEELMRASGIDPNEVRARLRERLMRDAVLQQEVYGGIWRGLTEKQKRDFYDAHKDKFLEPGELKISELFLSVEGRSFTEIEGKAKEIVAAARSGQTFSDLVKKHGDPSRPSFANNGSIGSFKSADELAPQFAKAITSLKTGDVTEPMRLSTEGVIILRLDERREAAPKKFEDVQNEVSYAMVFEQSREAEVKYLKKLREQAYIKVADGYASETQTTAQAKGE
jgi:parvulin-like peptidyl-prolyl isomerase